MIKVQLSNERPDLTVDTRLMRSAVRYVMEHEGVLKAEVSVAIVDDATIHRLNRHFLKHDYATDVLSFLFDDADNCVDGEIVVSADTAARVARDHGWSTADELLLYVIHGSLHLVGYDDQSSVDRTVMMAREQLYLRSLGVMINTDEPGHPELDGYASSATVQQPGREEQE